MTETPREIVSEIERIQERERERGDEGRRDELVRVSAGGIFFSKHKLRPRHFPSDNCRSCVLRFFYFVSLKLLRPSVSHHSSCSARRRSLQTLAWSMLAKNRN